MLKILEWTGIINTAYMVFVRVCNQDAIQFSYLVVQHLLPEIGRGINDHCGGFRFNQYAATQAFVVHTCRRTNFALTAYHWHTTAGAGAQKCNLKGWYWHEKWKLLRYAGLNGSRKAEVKFLAFVCQLINIQVNQGN